MSDGPLPALVEQAQALVARVLAPGGVAVDGTVGNGHDTCFLAERVGSRGRVVGFDVQRTALATARQRLDRAGLLGRVTLVERGHERLRETLVELALPDLQAAMFNLGYLPGGDKRVITGSATTLMGLNGALSLLAPGGLLTVLLYPGHPGGAEESDAVLRWVTSLPPAWVQVMHVQMLATRLPAPTLLAIARRG